MIGEVDDGHKNKKHNDCTYGVFNFNNVQLLFVETSTEFSY